MFGGKQGQWVDVVEEILRHKGCPKRRRSMQFLVRWLGFGPEYDSWEPWDNVRTCMALRDYLVAHKLGYLVPRNIDYSEEVDAS